MAIYIHKLDSAELLTRLEEESIEILSDIFEKYQQWTGLGITEYKDQKLLVENQITLVKIIDKYIEETNINLNKKKTSEILEFKGLLKYFISNNISLFLKGE